MTKSLKSFVTRHLPDFTLLIYLLAAMIGAFSGGIWAALGITAGIVLFVGVWWIGRKPPLPQTNLAILVAVFLLITAILNFQSVDPALSWKEWLRLLTVFVPLLLLLSPSVAAQAGHRHFFTIMPVAVAAGGIALSIQLYLKAHALRQGQLALGLAHYNRGFSHLMLLSLPAMAGLWFSKKRWLVVPFFILLLIPASLTESRSSKLALMLAVPVMLCAAIAPVLVRRLLLAGTVIAMAWPFAAREFFLRHYDMLARIPDSWRARIEIWDYMSYRILEKPLLGWGLGTSHVLPFGEPHGAQYVFTIMPAAHPHNVMTELWVELGLPGLALGFAFAFLTLRKAARLDPRLVPFALGAWMAGLCLSLIAYDFWTDSLFAAFALTALAFMMLERRLASRPSKDAPEARR